MPMTSLSTSTSWGTRRSPMPALSAARRRMSAASLAAKSGSMPDSFKTDSSSSTNQLVRRGSRRRRQASRIRSGEKVMLQPNARAKVRASRRKGNAQHSQSLRRLSASAFVRPPRRDVGRVRPRLTALLWIACKPATPALSAMNVAARSWSRAQCAIPPRCA